MSEKEHLCTLHWFYGIRFIALEKVLAMCVTSSVHSQLVIFRKKKSKTYLEFSDKICLKI